MSEGYLLLQYRERRAVVASAEPDNRGYPSILPYTFHDRPYEVAADALVPPLCLCAPDLGEEHGGLELGGRVMGRLQGDLKTLGGILQGLQEDMAHGVGQGRLELPRSPAVHRLPEVPCRVDGEGGFTALGGVPGGDDVIVDTVGLSQGVVVCGVWVGFRRVLVPLLGHDEGLYHEEVDVV